MIQPTTKTKWKRAFTLIELLVVIAIISLLVSILLPSLQQAKLLAQQVQCMTTLRNMGTASAMAMEEQGGKMIGVREKHVVDGYHVDVLWMANPLLRQGMNVPEAILNPSDPLYDQRYYVPLETTCPLSYAYMNPRADYGGTCKWHNSYGWNITHLVEVGTYPTDVDWRTEMDMIKNPADKLQMADGVNYSLRKDCSDRYFEEEPMSSYTPAFRHGGRINIEYFDGHVDNRPEEEVVDSDEIWDVYGEDFTFDD